MKWIATALLLLSLAGCGSMGLKKPEVSLSNIEPGSSTLFEQNFAVTLRVANPNPIPLNASGVDFELMLGGEKLGGGSSQQAVSIPSRGEGMVTLQVHTSLAAGYASWPTGGSCRAASSTTSCAASCTA